MSKMSKIKKDYVKIMIAVIIFILIELLLKPVNGLTELGVSGIAIFVSIIWIWVTVEQIWSSLLGIALIIIFKIASQGEILKTAFGAFGPPFIMMCSLLNIALTETGVIEHIAQWFITRKVCEGRPWVFISMFTISAFVVGLFFGCVPVTLCYLTLADGICKELGYEKGSKFGAALTIANLFVVVVAYGVTPISHPGAVYMMGYLEAVGYPISMTQFMLTGIPFGIIFVALTLIALRLFLKIDMDKFDSYDVAEHRKAIKPLTKKAKITLWVFALVVFCWIGGDIIIGFMPAAGTWIKGLGLVAPCIVGICILNNIHVDGDEEPILPIAKKLPEVPWGAVVFGAGMEAIASLVSNSNTGIQEWLANMFQPIANSLSPTVVVWVVMAIVIISTQFLTNLVVQALIWTSMSGIIIAMNAGGANISVIGFGLMIAYMCNVAFLVPSSQIDAPMCFQSGYLDDVGDVAKVGIPVLVAMYLLGMLIIWPMCQAIFPV